MRVPNAVWRLSEAVDSGVECSCMVIASEGSFSFGGRNRKTQEEVGTYRFSIQLLLELHAERPQGETFFIYDGVFANEQSSESASGRWVTLMHELDSSCVLP